MPPKKPTTPRRRRSVDPMMDLPGLFDNIDIDMSRDELAANVAKTLKADIEAALPKRHVSPAADRQQLEIDPSTLVKPSSMRFMSFGSGSSGNCAYLGLDEGGRQSGILIDAGVDPHTVMQALRDNRIDPKSITGILLTHDHGDHVKYAYTILRNHRHMVLYATPRTLSGILRRHNISRRIKDYHKAIYKEFPFQAGALVVTAFETSHDGTDNVGFAIDSPDLAHRFVVATDMGMITERAAFYMKSANYIMLESNYDSRMLAVGPYPEYLKARIAGTSGHLDNVVSASFVAENYHPSLSHVFLCHLSADNNTPELALSALETALNRNNIKTAPAGNPLALPGNDVAIGVLPRFDPSQLYILRHK